MAKWRSGEVACAGGPTTPARPERLLPRTAAGTTPAPAGETAIARDRRPPQLPDPRGHSAAGPQANPLGVGERPAVGVDLDPVRPGCPRRRRRRPWPARGACRGPGRSGSRASRSRRSCRSSCRRRARARRRTSCSRTRPRRRAGARCCRCPGWPGRCPSWRRRDLPDRAVGGLHDASDAPQGLLDGLQHGRSRGDRGVEQCADVGRLRHDERHREPAEAAGRGIRRPQAHLRGRARRRRRRTAAPPRDRPRRA